LLHGVPLRGSWHGDDTHQLHRQRECLKSVTCHVVSPGPDYSNLKVRPAFFEVELSRQSDDVLFVSFLAMDSSEDPGNLARQLECYAVDADGLSKTAGVARRSV
jgi:hypothetical protein